MRVNQLRESHLKMKQTTEQVLEPNCPHCGSKNVYGMTRVVGYFSKIDNWNKSKLAEFKDRQKGSYGL